MNLRWISTGLIEAALIAAPGYSLQNQPTPRVTTASKPAETPKVKGTSERKKRVQPDQRRTAPPAKELTRRFLEMPLDFEANRGQAPKEYVFVAHGPSYALGISASSLALSLHQPGSHDSSSAVYKDGLDASEPFAASNLRLSLAGATGVSQVTGLDEQTGRSNYFIGNDPAKWRTNIAHFKRVKVAEVYPGIDLIFYGNHQQLEYDFSVAPGGDPDRIRLKAEGADSLTLDAAGNAILHTSAGNVQLKRPVAYQEFNGKRKLVSSGFRLLADDTLQFHLGRYDSSKPLVIDPVLLYAVSIGGSNGSQGIGMAVDANGNTYLTGNTCSVDFPTTAGNFQNMPTNVASKNCQSAFVVKLDPTASTLIFSDYIGGSGSNSGAHLAVDSSGDVFVAGATNSLNFPTVNNIGPTAPAGCGIASSGYDCPDGFILKLNPDGSQLLFSSLLGGASGASGAFQVKLNPATGDVVVLGATNSAHFEPAPNMLETAYGGGACSNVNGCFNSFLLGLDPTSGAMRYGTFLGGAGNDWVTGLAMDSTGNIYVTGSAQLPFSTTLGTVTHTYAPSGGATAGGTDIFAAQFKLGAPNTLTLGYLTVIQGEGDGGGSGIAVDASGNAYVIGSTVSQHLPVTAGVFQSTNNSNTAYPNVGSCIWATAVRPFLPQACGTAFVGKLNPSGALAFLTYMGGTGPDWGQAIGVDSTGNLWLTGVTSSSNFPFSTDAYNFSGYLYTPFLAEMSSDGTKLPFATPITSGHGQSTDLVIDSSNNIYVAGFSSGAPSTPGTYPADPAAYTPAFIQKWNSGAQPALTISTGSLTFSGTAIGAVSDPQSVTLQNTGAGVLDLAIQMIPSSSYQPPDFLESDNCGPSLVPNASCIITVTFEPQQPSSDCVTSSGCDPQNPGESINILSNAPNVVNVIGVLGTLGSGAILSVTPYPIVFTAQAAGTSSANTDVKVENLGDVPLQIGNIALSGPDASDFQLTTVTGGPVSTPPSCPNGCQLELKFSPASTSTGTRTAEMVFSDNAADVQQSVPVTGTVSPAGALMVSPATVSIGPVVVGSIPLNSGTGNFGVIALSNPSTSSIQVTGLSISGTNQADFTLWPNSSCQISPLPLVIPAGTSCNLQINFQPSSGNPGLRTASLTITTNTTVGSTSAITLQGDAVTNTSGTVNFFTVPATLNFGNVQLGQATNPNNSIITIYNEAPISPCAGGATTCGGPLTITSITPGLSDYTITQAPGESCSVPVTIPSGGNCEYYIQFAPASAGDRNSTLTINSNDPVAPATLPLYGTGLALAVGQLSQTSLNFGSSAIGVASPPLNLLLQNTGHANMTVSSMTASANFAVSSNSCTSPLAPNATCALAVTFTPPAAGAVSGTLTIADNAAFNSQQVVALSGTGATGPSLRISPTFVNFGNQIINAVSQTQTVTVTSTGDTTLAFPANSIRTSSGFILQSTTCGTSLPPGESCTVNLQFEPTTTLLPTSGSLLITDNAPGNPQAVYMEGTGVQAGSSTTTTALTSSLNPSTSGQAVTFTATVAGTAGSTPAPTGSVTFLDGTTTLATVTVSSSGTAAYTATSLASGSHSITALYSGDTTYASSTSSVLTQVVNPVAMINTTTLVSSSANPSTSGQAVTFTATVAAPAGSTPAPTGSVTFLDGTTTLGATALTPSGSAGFSTSALSVGTHQITAQYSGDTTYAGSTSAALAQVVNTAAVPGFSLSVSPATIKVTPGQSGTVTLKVTPDNGFNQAVSFACSGLPSEATCSFSPATVTPSGTTAAATTMTISTTAATTSENRMPWPFAGGGTALAFALFFFRKEKRLPMFLCLALLLSLGGMAIGCGGGGNKKQSGNTGTPAGNSTVTVTATSGSGTSAITQTVTVALTVQ